MKNISRFKLSIDRTKAPKKMGTFKDIYLFVNYVFPVEGHFTSLAGVGKEVKTTKVQLQKISSWDTPMAGSTGSLISWELPPEGEGKLHSHPDQSETYSIFS